MEHLYEGDNYTYAVVYRLREVIQTRPGAVVYCERRYSLERENKFKFTYMSPPAQNLLSTPRLKTVKLVPAGIPRAVFVIQLLNRA